ncbi:MAG: four helix bundle protein [Acidimicrobiia bacterium]|nr:MAG: four helix bundle protein [Acidimicrobiia bacterium]
MRDFRRLLVWQRAHALTLKCDQLSDSFPSGERFALASQIRRSAASVGATSQRVVDARLQLTFAGSFRSQPVL